VIGTLVHFLDERRKAEAAQAKGRKYIPSDDDSPGELRRPISG
jgi:hypothetical protein